MKNKLLLTFILLLIITSVFADKELPLGFKLSQVLFGHVNMFSVVDNTQNDEPFNNIEILRSTLVGGGFRLKKSFFFTYSELSIPLSNTIQTSPVLDINTGLTYQNYSAVIGKVFSNKGYFQPYYLGTNTEINMNKILFDIRIQYIFGDFTTEHLDTDSYPQLLSIQKTYETNTSMRLKITLPLEKSFAYLEISADKWSFSSELILSLALGISFYNKTFDSCNHFSQKKHSRSEVWDGSSEKPNIYLYPEETTQVHVTIKPNGKITQSDPEYNSGWDVQIEPNGMIEDKYTFLFYEADVKYTIPDKGWNVKSTNLESFLEKTLTKYGLCTQEIADFLEYWTERLPESSHYLIYPFANDELENICPISINPKPDNILRLWFLFEPAQSATGIRNPVIPKFDRTGFDVVEWGGILKDE